MTTPRTPEKQPEGEENHESSLVSLLGGSSFSPVEISPETSEREDEPDKKKGDSKMTNDGYDLNHSDLQNSERELMKSDGFTDSDSKFGKTNTSISSSKKSKDIAERFDQFLQKKEHITVDFDESRIDLAPSPLRPSLLTMLKTIKRLAARNPTGASLAALQILIERFDEFLELQTRRDDPTYEDQCRVLLGYIYKNTSEAMRLSRKLKDAAQPRPVDEC
ncbi:hypothetical protein TVAG_492980 [Trichomonas vaginalis G3]|uniref:Uncharacterized protein n=1 Tax=Trichomonas vaginalis (strain ATCC PRA-98 / G3) TaxID=412133 RepID=A2FUU1_TRIV3|nr:hypothetical protein TVAGG3_0155950 [Trichomonas vaginalis G3]EAX91330.1 hypothetical protein TVAG_492980 [Trichomonas vaginalis G3]KAI5547560.1 hypothetical protein TVAGG3_0155950 [Trichomonas vaginalis G3]|eukprot:XP_001304260.1 hypothetical protein [Trichomonas vaginalis G3]